MAEEACDQSTAASPQNGFHFLVEWDNQVMFFQEAIGLDGEPETIQYRRGDSPEFSPIRMPGLKKSGNVTLKKGIVKADQPFWDWVGQIKMNTIKRASVRISLIDDSGNTVKGWTLANAWATEIGRTDLDSDGNEAAVERIELTHEGVTVVKTR